jgi:hypothetical protein
MTYCQSPPSMTHRRYPYWQDEERLKVFGFKEARASDIIETRFAIDVG